MTFGVKEMQKDANIYDIAKMAGVSKSTVSRVINGQGGVSEATRAKVQQAIDECTYIPNNSARSLSSLSTQTVVLLVHGIVNPFFLRIISLILDKMNGQKLDVLLHNYEPGAASITDVAISLCKEKRPKGLILLGGNFEGSQASLRALNIPIVMASTTMHGDDRSWFSSITINDEDEGVKMASYVCEKGHRQIGVIGRFYPREMGLNRIFGQHGVMPAWGDMSLDGAGSYQAGYLATKQLLEQGEYSCFVCLSDVFAIGAMKAVQEKGLRIPEDISIVGFDGIENGKYTHPTLTTFAQPYDEMAEACVSTLMGVIEEEAPHKHIILGASLHEGGSFKQL